MNRKLFFLFAAIVSLAVFCQNLFTVQGKQQLKNSEKSVIQIRRQISEAPTAQQDNPSSVGRCKKPADHEDFVFTGRAKEILPYQKKSLRENEQYWEPREEFKPKQTVRFAVDKVYQSPRDGDDNVKEIMADVFADDTHPAKTFKVGENYLVYATPRYHGKNSYTLKDNLIVYPDTKTQLVSEAQELVSSLKTPPPTETINYTFGIDSKEFISLNGIVNGKASRLVQPKYPEEAKKRKAGGRVEIILLIDETGTVIKTKAECADDESLIKVSKDAALKSKFAPVLISGKPVKVAGIVVYNFVAQ